MSAPTTHDPLVVNTRDGVCWERRAVTPDGRGLYAVEGSCKCPEFVMATLAELAEHGIVGSAHVLPVPVGPEPRTLDKVEDELTGANLSLWEEEQETARLRLALKSAQRGRRELRARVAALESERHSTNESLSEAAEALRVQRDRITEHDAQCEALAERMRAGQRWERGRNPELVSENLVSQSELRSIFEIPLTTPWESEAAAKCRCSEPGADPYACEAEDCTHEFSELSPFGGGPVVGRDAKVSKVCGCGWRTSVWHVDDGSVEAELHGHVVRVHGGTYPGGESRG